MTEIGDLGSDDYSIVRVTVEALSEALGYPI